MGGLGEGYKKSISKSFSNSLAISFWAKHKIPSSNSLVKEVAIFSKVANFLPRTRKYPRAELGCHCEKLYRRYSRAREKPSRARFLSFACNKGSVQCKPPSLDSDVAIPFIFFDAIGVQVQRSCAAAVRLFVVKPGVRYVGRGVVFPGPILDLETFVLNAQVGR